MTHYDECSTYVGWYGVMCICDSIRLVRINCAERVRGLASASNPYDEPPLVYVSDAIAAVLGEQVQS